MIWIYRMFKGEKFPIGYIENIGRREWLFGCYGIGEEFQVDNGGGCATTRVEAERLVREAWRNTLKANNN